MSLYGRALDHKRLFLTIPMVLTLMGLASWATMPKREDPEAERRWGTVLAYYPGADAETVERLVLNPLEEYIAEVAEIKWVVSTAQTGLALIELELADDVSDFDKAWKAVRAALRNARAELPDGVPEPTLDDHTGDQETVVLGITGSTDPLVLLDKARRVKQELLGVRGVARIKLIGDPGEQILVEYDDAVARRHGITARHLTGLLGQRSQIIPGGSVILDGRVANLRPETDFRSLDELARTPIPLPSGAAIPLRQLARLQLTTKEPGEPRMRFNAERAVGLGVIARDGIDLVEFGDRIRKKLNALRPQLSQVKIQEVTFQPDRVGERLDGLQKSLFLGLGILSTILIGLMGMRLGIVVTSVVPLVSLTTLGLYAAGGGELHQMSVSALLISLGMLVDNAIVMSENIQSRLDAGTPIQQAVIDAVRELALPLATASGTTLAAFLPMLIADGPTAGFVRAIPVVVMLTLVIGYLYSVWVTPMLSALLLRKRPGIPHPKSPCASGPVSGSAIGHQSVSLKSRLATFSARRYRLVLAGTALLLFLVAALAPHLREQFFPLSDRNQLVVDLRLPDGAHLDEIDHLSRKVEARLLTQPNVRSVAAFIGRSTPLFYYNLPVFPYATHRAQLLVTTLDTQSVQRVAAFVRQIVHNEFAKLDVVARPLEQGPPVSAPVELWLLGHDLEDLRQASETVMEHLRQIPGAIDVRSDIGVGAPVLEFAIDDAAAARRGVTRADVAMALVSQTRGAVAGYFRVGDDPIPIVVRSSAGEWLPVEALAAVDVPGTAGPVPLGQLTKFHARLQPASIRHRNRQRVVTVAAQLVPGFTQDVVVDAFRSRLTAGPKLGGLSFPAGITLEFGGEARGSDDASASMLRTLPFGVLLLLLCLIAEFNSFRKVGIVLSTIPLSLIGVIPGLFLTDQPFGFMSLLGLIALIGIVVNNAIVLLDVVDRRRAMGDCIAKALQTAVEQRTRPILLTALTTIAGLLPLAFSPTTLWPPFAWALITGLVASTALSLFVVPALYRLLFRTDSPVEADQSNPTNKATPSERNVRFRPRRTTRPSERARRRTQ